MGVKESYTPVLLRLEARRLRSVRRDESYWSRFDNDEALVQKLSHNLRRPIVLAATEPMLVLWNLYVGLIYGLLYLSFAAYPVIFGELRGWSVSM